VAQVLRHVPAPTDPNLLVGTQTHDDAGVYQLAPDLAIVQTVDFFPPVVDDPFIYGQIAAANALSDVFAMGGTPKTALNMVGFPDAELDMEVLGRIIDGGSERMRAAECTVLGGHTVRDAEVKFGYAVTGTIHPKKIITNAGARPGDVLVLTKPLGTAFVTTAAKKEKCPPELLQAACESMVQLNSIGRDAMLAVGAHAATDVTGFALAGHGFEMAEGSNVTLRIELAKLPAFTGIEELIIGKFFTRATKSNKEYVQNSIRYDDTPDPIRSELLFDAQTSGGLLIAVPSDSVNLMIALLKNSGALAYAIIGEVLPRQDVALIVA
jgi:selenide,water dikinase